MSIKFTAKNTKLTGALKGFAEKQLQSIEKISGDIIDAEIIVNEEKLDYKVEITLKTKLNSYHIEDKDPILKQALRSSLGTLKAQAKKNKEKMKKEKKRQGKSSVFQKFMGGREEHETPEAGGDSPQVTIVDNCSRKPLTVEEAAFFLNESGENAYMFVNVETNKMSVLFYNKQNNLSLIEAV